MGEITSEEFDKRLRGFFGGLEPKIQVKALRSAMRRQMNHARKSVMAEVRSSGIHNAEALAKTVWGFVGRSGTFWKVTTGFSKKLNKGLYPSRTAKSKFIERVRYVPVLLWLDGGTRVRKTKKGFRRGTITGGKWLRVVRAREVASSNENIEAELQKIMKRTAKRYGFTG